LDTLTLFSPTDPEESIMLRFTIFFILYFGAAIVGLLLRARFPKSSHVDLLKGVLVLVGGLALAGGLFSLDRYGFLGALSIASGPLAATVAFVVYEELFKKREHRGADKVIKGLLVMTGAIAVLALIGWAQWTNIVDWRLKSQFSDAIQRSAAIVEKSLADTTHSTLDNFEHYIKPQLLTSHKYIVVEGVHDTPQFPDLKISSDASSLPIASEPRDLTHVVVVLKAERNVRQYVGTSGDYRWEFTCYVVDLQSGTVRTTSPTFHGSAPSDRAGQLDGGDLHGTEPWDQVVSWINSISAT
jgi:hypothetical protein